MRQGVRLARRIVTILTAVLACSAIVAGAAQWEAGYRPGHLAIAHVRLVPEPGAVVEDGLVVMREGVISYVGKFDRSRIPTDAVIVEAKGLHAYAGFVDAFTTAGVRREQVKTAVGAGRNVDYSSYSLAMSPPDNRKGLTPDFDVATALSLGDSDLRARHAGGLTLGIHMPPGAILSGQGALVAYNGLPRRESLVRRKLGLHIAFGALEGRGYPTVLMGQIAHLRQFVLDARHYEELWRFYREHGGNRPPQDVAYETLRDAQRRRRPVFWEANSADEIDRALWLAKEFGLRPVIVGGAEAWKREQVLARRRVPLVFRLDFPEKPKKPEKVKYKDGLPLKEPQSYRVYRERLRLWEARLRGIASLAEKAPVAFSTEGLSKPEELLRKLELLFEYGLDADAALRALTVTPAQLAGVADRLGTLKPGKLAHLVLLQKRLGEKGNRVELIVADGILFRYGKQAQLRFAGEPPAEEKARAESGEEQPEQKEASATKEAKKGAEKAGPDRKREKAETEQEKPEREAKPAEKEKEEKPVEPYPTEIEADRKPQIRTGGNVLIRGATVLTVTRGTLRDADILVRGGKIAAIGKGLEAPKGITVIDARGMYVMPGIIDTHAHIAIDRGVNEFSLTVVPEVRVKDVIKSDDVAIYRALAGGTTTARLLHGSANPIGGQDAVIKLKWGKSAEEMLIADAPQGVKFALGENPKRSPTRFPNTRVGVEAVIRRAFDEALAYRQVWQRFFQAKERGIPVPEPRRDLRLEALVRILEGEYKIHCHCYRADEILMILNTAARYGIRVQSLQHVLEGYKVAAEIAAHGASTSTFADWWAYKVEAYDAIPHNAAFLLRAGVVSTLKSDSPDLIRHLYQEAAKTMRYGGLSEDEALALVTINPARQLGLDHRIGSIEVGKDADLAIFNGHPLNGYSRCEMTIIDGEVYFQRAAELHPAGYDTPRPPEQVRGASIEIPHGPRPRVLVLRNAHLFPVTAKPIERGTVLIRGDKIAAIGGPDLPVPEDAVVVDVKGLRVYPGMINSGGTLGLSEIGSVRETHDYAERGQFNPDLLASIAIHPESGWIGVTRTNGVLAALSHPLAGSAGIAGQGVLIKLDGWVPQEMIIRDGLTLHMRLPSLRNRDSENRDYQRELSELEEKFRLALHYRKQQQLAAAGKAEAPQPDPKLAALAPFAAGEKLVVIHASDYMSIVEAIRFARKLKLRWLLADAAEAWKCPDLLVKNNVRVLLGPATTMPRSAFDPYDAYYSTAATLHKAGVPFALKSTGFGPDSATGPRNLPFEAALAASYGLDIDEALKAVTINPARLLGVDDLLGSIEVGKLANLVICDGDLLQPATQVKAIVIAGKLLPPTNRQTELYHRYLERLRQVRVGEAKLGLIEPEGN